MANLGNTVVSGKLTVTDSATIKGKKVITIADLATVATTGSYNDLLNKPSILLLNNAPSWKWGTLTTGNGYTLLGSSNGPGGGSVAFAEKGGQTSIQIDGRYYDQEGKYRLVDTADLSSSLSSYVTLSTAQTISGKKTFSTAGGFVYSGIEESASGDSLRPIWFGSNGQVSVPVYSNNLTFNPSTGNLKSDHIVTDSLMSSVDSDAPSITFDANDIWIGNNTVSSTGTYPNEVFVYSDVFAVYSRLSEFKNNLRAKSLTSTQNSDYIDFITSSGVNFGVKGNSGTVYNLSDIVSDSTRTIGSGTLTIQKNGSTVKTFSANSTTDVLANITVPTKLSELTNDSINNGVLTIQANGTNKGTFSANQSSNTTVNITAKDLGVSSAMIFGGVASQTLSEGGTQNATATSGNYSASTQPSNGTVFLDKGQHLEYVWVNGSGTTTLGKWELLGQDGSYALSSVTVTGTGALGGGGNLSSNRTITHNVGTAASKASGFYKISTDAYSHVASVTAVTKADITNLGIPGQDSHYTNALKLNVGDTNIVSYTQNADKTLKFISGDNVTLVGDASAGSITIKSANTWRGIQNNLTSTSTADSLSAYQGKLLNDNKVAKQTALADGIDLNTVQTSGFYRLKSTYTNGPSGGSMGFGQLIVCSGGGDTISQFAMPYSSSVVYVRNGNVVNNTSGVWKDWIRLASASEIPSSLKNPYYLNIVNAEGETMSYDGSFSTTIEGSFYTRNLVSRANTETWTTRLTGVDIGGSSTYSNMNIYDANDTLSYNSCVKADCTGAPVGHSGSATVDCSIITQRWDNGKWGSQLAIYQATNVENMGIAYRTIDSTGTPQQWVYAANTNTRNIFSGSNKFTKHIRIDPSESDYREGIRIHSYNNYADIILCGNDNTDDSGTSANTWGIFNNNGAFGIGKNGEGITSGTYTLNCKTDGIWRVNGYPIVTSNNISSYTAGSANKDGSGNTITSTYVKRTTQTSSSVLYANATGSETTVTYSSTGTTPGTMVYRNGSTGYSVISTPSSETSTSGVYIANTGYVNSRIEATRPKVIR